jgi:serine protease AprX
MHKAITSIRIVLQTAVIVVCAAAASAGPPPTIGPLVAQRALWATGSSRVIVTAAEGRTLPEVAEAIHQSGGVSCRALAIIDACAAEVPNPSLLGLANSGAVAHIALDRFVAGTLERTAATIGATAVRQELGYDGSGIGIVVIDSGVTSYHDDLAGLGSNQRVDGFVDFVNGRYAPYDDYGHGTHVAGIIAGNGADSGGLRSGIAPNARIIALKVLDAQGRGYISDVIDALQYAVANRDALNIRVINLSVGTGVYESYRTDPLTKAARKAVAAGIVVVAAAGNFGHDLQGHTLYGGITAPGNAPWVLTVGASNHMGSADRADDTIALFSSRGPTAIDVGAKPDLVAPGVGIESLSDPASTFYNTQSAYLLPGVVPTTYLPYLSQSGTSMSAPVVSGTVALMFQANPALTPNQVKAILQYTAQVYPGHDPLTEGAGFLNAKGAVDLARYFAGFGSTYPTSADWSGRLIWGNRLLTGGHLLPDANAWSRSVTWGSSTTPDGQPIEFGVACATSSCENDTSLWTLASFRNVVWGPMCGGADCSIGWTVGLFGTAEGDTVVWGTSDGGDTVVWGTTDGDTVVWGTSDGGDTVVWGTDSGDTVVWGTSCIDPSCVPVIWKQ